MKKAVFAIILPLREQKGRWLPQAVKGVFLYSKRFMDTLSLPKGASLACRGSSFDKLRMTTHHDKWGSAILSYEPVPSLPKDRRAAMASIEKLRPLL
ncbi:MAG: hypothetical protein IEMM0002_0750 [bacterium]|nr:MAG: hypothetical protein IEMM0002_0750 [bacterium]